jgi:hypothetical protein
MPRLFRNPRWAVVAISIFLGLILATFATRCHGLTAEAGMAVIRGQTPAISLYVPFGRSETGSDHHYECGMALIGESERAANQIAASCLIVDGLGPIELGIGPAILANEDRYNSGRINFSLVARWNVTERLSLTWRHYSNAGTHMPNVGRDVVLVGWTF